MYIRNRIFNSWNQTDLNNTFQEQKFMFHKSWYQPSTRSPMPALNACFFVLGISSCTLFIWIFRLVVEPTFLKKILQINNFLKKPLVIIWTPAPRNARVLEVATIPWRFTHQIERARPRPAPKLAWCITSRRGSWSGIAFSCIKNVLLRIRIPLTTIRGTDVPIPDT